MGASGRLKAPVVTTAASLAARLEHGRIGRIAGAKSSGEGVVAGVQVQGMVRLARGLRLRIYHRGLFGESNGYAGFGPGSRQTRCGPPGRGASAARALGLFSRRSGIPLQGWLPWVAGNRWGSYA